MTDYIDEPDTLPALIERDHRVIRGLLDRLDSFARHERGDAFRAAVEYLVRHEIAEEHVVFPALTKALPDTQHFVDEALHDQSQVEAHLVRMELMDASSLDFWDELGLLRRQVSEHSTREEQVILPMLRGSDVDLVELGRDYELARTTAPTHVEAPEPDEAGEDHGHSLFARLRHALGRK